MQRCSEAKRYAPDGEWFGSEKRRGLKKTNSKPAGCK
jgi:hypothetical protein